MRIIAIGWVLLAGLCQPALVTSDGLEGSVAGITFPLERYHYDVFRVPYDLEAPLDQVGGRKAQFFYDKAGAIERVGLPLEEAVPDIVFVRAKKEAGK